MEREIIEPDLKQLDHDRDLREQQIKDRIEKAGEYHQEIQKTVDEIQENIKLENQMIEEQALAREFNNAEHFRGKLEASIGQAKEILHSYIKEKNIKEKNIENINRCVSRLSSTDIEQFEKLDIDSAIEELKIVVQDENKESEDFDILEDFVPEELNKIQRINPSPFSKDFELKNKRNLDQPFVSHTDAQKRNHGNQYRRVDYLKHNQDSRNLQNLQFDKNKNLEGKQNQKLFKDKTLIDSNKITEVLSRVKEQNG